MNPDYIVLGIDWPREELRKRLVQRAHLFFAQNIERETEEMAKLYGWDCQAMKSNAYPIVQRMIDGEITREEAINEFALDDWHLAKRQLTWFKRNKNINWMPLNEAKDWLINLYLC